MTSSRPSAAATDRSPDQPDADEPQVSRRVFLKASGAAVAAASVTIPAVAQDATPAPMGTPMASPMASPVSTTGKVQVSALQFFNPAEAAMVDAITARLLPGTSDDPGAREAGAMYFIDQALSGSNQGYTVKTYIQGPFLAVTEDQAPVETTSRPDIYQVIPINEADVSRYGFQSVLSPQEVYRRGLLFMDAYAQSAYGASFVELSEDKQDAVLTDMEGDTATGFDGPGAAAFFNTLRNDTIAGVFSDPLYGGNRDLVGWKLIGYPGARGYYTAAEIQDSSFSAEPVSLADMTMPGHGS